MCKLLPEKIKVKTTFCGNLIMGGIADMKLLTILEVKGIVVMWKVLGC